MFKKVWGILPFFLLVSCGAMDDMLSTGRNVYQVNCFIEGRSLKSYSIVSAGDKISPAFLASVVNDPDVAGLAVYVEDYNGRQLSGRVRYTLEKAKPAGEEAAGTVVESLSGDLPPFTLPSSLEPGAYRMAFEVLGLYGVLYKNLQDFFYIKNVEFNFEKISAYFPAEGLNQRLIPTSTPVLLEANLRSSGALDPYVVWYRDGRKLEEGKYSEDTHRLFLKTPEENGFISLKAEIYPFEAPESIRKTTRGVVREISLPVSDKTGLEPSLKVAGGAQHLYTFWGNLDNSGALGGSLDGGESPRWAPLGEIYGLGIGPEDQYSIQNLVLSFAENKTNTFAFQLAPGAPGLIFKAEFEKTGAGTLEFSLLREEKGLTLSAKCSEAAGEISLPLEGPPVWTSLTLKIVYAKNRLIFALSGAGELELSLTGRPGERGVFQLGGGAADTAAVNDAAAAPDAAAVAAVVAVNDAALDAVVAAAAEAAEATTADEAAAADVTDAAAAEAPLAEAVEAPAAKPETNAKKMQFTASIDKFSIQVEK
jgi:hypothetical protein